MTEIAIRSESNENSNSLGHIDEINQSGYIALDKYGDRFSIEILENPFLPGMFPERGDMVIMAINDLHTLFASAKATRLRNAELQIKELKKESEAENDTGGNGI